MRLRKLKRPAGAHVFDVRPVTDDEFGVWLYVPRGAKWEAPHDTGTCPFEALVLLNPRHAWVAWWVDDPANRRVEIDVCLRPDREDDQWSYVDLELDVIRHEDGSVEIVDQDEFNTACQDGWIM